MRALRSYCLSVICLLLAACSASEQEAEADKIIATFRSQFVAQQYAQLYQQCSASCKKTVSQADFVKFMHKAASDIGAFKSATRQGISINKVAVSTSKMLPWLAKLT